MNLDPEAEAGVAELLRAIRERFRVCSVYAKAPFADFAKSSNSPIMVDHVTRAQFIQGLASLGIHPSADEIELLLRKYDDDGDGNVNYLSFCRDVDCLETFSSRSKAPSEHHVTLHGGFRFPRTPEDLEAR